jgi:Ca2+-binding RTX toxin-like protein
LFIKAGTNLDFETQSSFAVTVEVDDPAIGSIFEDSINFSLTLTNINEIDGNNAANFLFGTRKNELIRGFGGNDILFGNGGNDTLNGGQGHDYLDGGIGNDILNGGEGNDILIGGFGDDVLMGGGGTDKLSGGFGNDQFLYKALNEAGDVILDFNRSQDQLVLTELFKDLGYTRGNPVADGYLRFNRAGLSTQVQIDSDGSQTAFNYTTLTTLIGVLPSGLIVGSNVVI